MSKTQGYFDLSGEVIFVLSDGTLSMIASLALMLRP